MTSNRLKNVTKTTLAERETDMNRIKVLLADNRTIVRQGIRALLESQGDIEVVGEAENGRQALRMTDKLRPAVVVMDLAMPVLSGLETSRQISKTFPAIRVLILASRGGVEYAKHSKTAGAKGYLTQQTSGEDLAKAIREVRKGNMFFSQPVSERTADYRRTVSDDIATQEEQCPGLTSRETETLRLVAEGYANKQIAAELDISIKTVEKHRQHVMEKLNIHETAGLTRYAIMSGLC